MEETSKQTIGLQRQIGLVGNPNVGKSTVFNALTGLKQHTGNWPGKTVVLAYGEYTHQQVGYTLVDLPGTYSLFTNTLDEEVASDFICFGTYDAIVVVVDATSLERNLNLVLQCLEVTENVVVCVNLMDEAKKRHIAIHVPLLAELLQVDVVACSAATEEGLDQLKQTIHDLVNDKNKRHETRIRTRYDETTEQAIMAIQSLEIPRWMALRMLDGDATFNEKMATSHGFMPLSLPSSPNHRDLVTTTIVQQSEHIARQVVDQPGDEVRQLDRRIDRYLTSPQFGIPLMIALLAFVFWLTIVGANVPSQWLASILFGFEDALFQAAKAVRLPLFFQGLLISGLYRTMAWVVSVMLPPMAIFFPLFTLLEDFGYLPRVAFNLDNYFKKADACGKQALTMCMGFGCNAVGVIGCRIIDSPRERLIAILTNNFVPCNGRFPMLIVVISMFFTGSLLSPWDGLLSTGLLTITIVFGVAMTFLVSKLLSKTILKGEVSSLILELPPYRKPQFLKVITRSIFDRTLFVLARAMMVAAPAGMLLWLCANTTIAGTSILLHMVAWLQPFAQWIGLDGFILIAFILGFPANEIVIPILLMSYLATGQLSDYESVAALRMILMNHGWTWVTAINVLIFTILHFPCGTTCLTIKKETGSWKWTLMAFVLPTLLGIACCFVVASVVMLFGLL